MYVCIYIYIYIYIFVLNRDSEIPTFWGHAKVPPASRPRRARLRLHWLSERDKWGQH